MLLRTKARIRIVLAIISLSVLLCKIDVIVIFKQYCTLNEQGPEIQCLLKVKGDDNPDDKYVFYERS